MILNKEVKEMALDFGADMVGVAAIESFSEIEDKYKLKELKQDVKSVIVLGFSINRGALRGVEEGTNWGAVNAGSPSNPMVIPSITYKFCKEFEKKYGYEATCLTKIPTSLVEVGVEETTEDIISFFDYAAYVAGLGEISAGKFFLTKEYGVRQYFAVVLTDADIEADSIDTNSYCDGCMECAKNCPYQAIDVEKTNKIVINGKEVKWCSLDVEKCFLCRTGAISSQYLDDGDFNILNRGAKAMNTSIEPSRISAACGRACVAHLEDTVLKGKFINKFRG